jgi:predicted lipoprotein with Yx(FWY)xxD motif
MKNTIIGVVILIILIVGGIAIFHKSPSGTNNSSTSSNNQASQAKAPAVNNAVVLTKTSSSLGQYLTDPSGKALYTYNADASGVSNCTGSCLSNWPAYQDTGATTGLPAGISTIKRTDNGQMQYTYNGMPLYYFTGDTGTQVTGNGVENFSVAKPPTGSSSTSSSPSSSSSSSSNNSSSGNPY